MSKPVQPRVYEITFHTPSPDLREMPKETTIVGAATLEQAHEMTRKLYPSVCIDRIRLA